MSQPDSVSQAFCPDGFPCLLQSDIMSARYSVKGRWPTATSMFGGLALQGSHTRKVTVSRLSRNSRRPSSKDMASSLVSARAPANFSSCHLKKYFPHGRHTTHSIRLLSTLILCDPSLLVSCPIPPEDPPPTRALTMPPLSIFFPQGST